MSAPTATATATALLSLSYSVGDHSFSLILSSWIVAAIVLVSLLYWCSKLLGDRWYGSNFEIDTAEIGLGSGKLSFKPNRADQQIAYAIWVELSTRKIGLPIDLEHDVIWEVYDSWHTFFSITRDLVKDIPVNKLKSDSTKKIITLSINVLNEGLRPHLTAWHARFRHWYEREIKKEGNDIDPQSIQSGYPKFEELAKDLLQVNMRLIKYREKMRDLVLGLSDSESDRSQTASESKPAL